MCEKYTTSEFVDRLFRINDDEDLLSIGCKLILAAKKENKDGDKEEIIRLIEGVKE